MFSADYDLALVAFSVLVAMLASCTALSLVQRIVPASITPVASIPSTIPSKTYHGLLASGACVMGAGIWSMHFIGMLAFRMPLHAGYDLQIIFLSLALTILVSGMAFHLAGTGGRSSWRLGAGAVLMGLAIPAMHYSGMASLRLSPAIVYSPQLVVASVAIAMAASGAALWFAFPMPSDARQRRLSLAMATAAMSLAIVGTHFIGMAAAAFPMESVSLADKDGFGQITLAITVIAATFSILASAIVTAMVDSTRESDVRTMSVLRAGQQERDSLLDQAAVTATPETSHTSHAAPKAIRLIPPDLKGASILVVEDCPVNQMIAGEYLEKTGVRVLMAAHGREALDVLARQRVDCVLMDMQLPEMSGLEATRRIRADARLAGLPVIAMTASAGAEDRAQCKAAGMNDFLCKPLVPDVFYGMLSCHLSKACAGDFAAGQREPARSPVNMVAPQATGMSAHEEVQEPAINLKVLSDMVQGDPKKLRHFALRFTASAQGNLLDIQRAMEQKNWSALAGLGHRCKSSARSVGAFQLAALCEALEKMPAALVEKEAPMLVARLQPMLDAIHREVGEWFHATQDG